MRCTHCHGTGVIETAYQHQPCNECQGYGVQHCCDGLREQPETSAAGAITAVSTSPADKAGPGRPTGRRLTELGLMYSQGLGQQSLGWRGTLGRAHDYDSGLG